MQRLLHYLVCYDLVAAFEEMFSRFNRRSLFTLRNAAVTVLLLHMFVLSGGRVKSRPLAAENALVSQHSHNASWNQYRIGDGIARYPGAPGCEECPHSIVCQYTKETVAKNDIPALVRVLDRGNWCRPPCKTKNLALLHLRLGDGLCAIHDEPCRGNRTDWPDCWNNDEDCWYDPGAATKQYAFSKDWYLSVMEELNLQHELQGIVIVSDKLHWTRTDDPRGGNFEVDDAYLNNVAAFFRTRFSHVELRSPGLPDDDFAFLCMAETFVSGGGGFSKLIAEVVKLRGGRVINPQSFNHQVSITRDQL